MSVIGVDQNEHKKYQSNGSIFKDYKLKSLDRRSLRGSITNSNHLMPNNTLFSVTDHTSCKEVIALKRPQVNDKIELGKMTHYKS